MLRIRIILNVLLALAACFRANAASTNSSATADMSATPHVAPVIGKRSIHISSPLII